MSYDPQRYLQSPWTFRNARLTTPDGMPAAHVRAASKTIEVFDVSDLPVGNPADPATCANVAERWSFDKTGSFMKFGLKAINEDDPQNEMVIHQPSFTVNELVLDLPWAFVSFARIGNSLPKEFCTSADFIVPREEATTFRRVTAIPKSETPEFIPDFTTPEVLGFTCFSFGSTIAFQQTQEFNCLTSAGLAFISYALNKIDGRGATTIRI